MSGRETLRRVGWLLVMALVPALIAAVAHPLRPSWNADDPGPGEVRLVEAATWERALWLDARTASAFAQGHVPGALLLSEERWSRDLEAVVNAWAPERPVVVYCDGRSCDAAHRAAARLRVEVGLEQVWVLRGGWDAWTTRAGR